ncbi:nicotinamide riboside transporter PnuC [Thiomicrorhabdus arctica]|jgi:nicotinamide mononucleotide transporter|uniref:nicotinamide riboside transporter PnuC n=1 Tax=Thiomicrorhabdus arctica TaxID=131540 RepID=UPI00036F21CE|nr:nicotinamide riboside transporter PnuC [Thiomicrorhabdus arctica]
MFAEENPISIVLNALLAQSGWEWLAASLGILYVILAAKESIWCWPAALVSTLIYTVLFWKGQLPMQAILNVYYMGMAVYGFILWQQQTTPKDNLRISNRPLKFHALFIGIGIMLTSLIGLYLSSIPGNRLPFLDAAVTVFSVMNTALMVRKVLENWLYWMVINVAAITLYFQTGYYVTILMFLVYLALAIYGYKNWRALQIQAQTA